VKGMELVTLKGFTDAVKAYEVVGLTEPEKT
jgi:hypothetical protein